MTVTVVMHGNLRRFMRDGAARATLDLPDGTTIEALLARLGASEDTWLVARNQVAAARDAVLAAGDVVDCFEPVAAG
jgi:sulfur carrier protein ThiS